MAAGAERERYRSSDAEPQILLDRGIEELMLGLKQGTSQRLEDYLAFTARFHRYSVNNQILIYVQCPHATFVAGYKTWKEMGYQVAGGQKGIRILAPRPFKRINDETGEEEEKLSFAVVSAFDVTQLANLDERPPPTFFKPLPDDQQQLYDELALVVRLDGISLEEGWTGPAQGYSRLSRIGLFSGRQPD